jgi:hypothetical protein
MNVEGKIWKKNDKIISKRMYKMGKYIKMKLILKRKWIKIYNSK